MTPIQDLKVGTIAQIKVSTPAYLVLEQTPNDTVFLTDQGTVERQTSGYAIVKSQQVKRYLNLNSGVSHIYHNGHPICGHRNTQNTELTEIDVINCQSCLRISGVN